MAASEAATRCVIAADLTTKSSRHAQVALLSFVLHKARGLPLDRETPRFASTREAPFRGAIAAVPHGTTTSRATPPSDQRTALSDSQDQRITAGSKRRLGPTKTVP